jgi:hypothetical protein
MRVYAIVNRQGKPTIRERNVPVRAGEILWPGPLALRPARDKLFKRRGDAEAELARMIEKRVNGTIPSAQPSFPI